MIKVDYVDTAKDLEDFSVEFKRKLKGMIAGFAYDITTFASENTPIGNAEDLDAGLSGYGSKANRSYANLYRSRFKEFGINTEVGFHKGAWYFSKDPSIEFNPEIQNEFDAANEVEDTARRTYQIGETFYIVGNGPGFNTFEAGENLQASSGIIGPTTDMILKTYEINLQRYYDRE